ncbi:MAG: tetratricopeptide repeat protein [Chloroflexi bacterium]|nr:tetratricopeptide repeat protein [Chloroflexota bacterium]MBP8057316.1 tetratricopeptide repeat protein [Chloroflexota bacterium]
MYQTNLIVRTKLTPLRPQKHTLHRPRLTQRLLEACDYRLTIVQAGTGYGKSTALAALAEQPYPLIWYRLDAEDRDPQRFLAHLLHGFAAALPALSAAPFAALEAWTSNRTTVSWTTIVDTLINECTPILATLPPCLLVLDDAHYLNQAPEPSRILDRLIQLTPHNLHIILGTRSPLPLPNLLTWRVKGELLEIGQDELAFTPTEIDDLFRTRFGHSLTFEQAGLLIERVEGWPIALHLVWKNLQKDGGAPFAVAVAQLAGTTSNLFAYLVQEVLSQQPAPIQSFLTLTAILRQMTAASCDFLRQAQDSQTILNYLLENGLFVVDLGEGHLRYHHLFRELLSQQLTPEMQQNGHRHAAAYFQAQGLELETMYHWLAASAYEDAAAYLQSLGREMVRTGRLDSLASWIGSIPPVVLANHPALLVYLGDIARLHSRFDEALNWYQQAEQHSRLLGDTIGLSQALRGQARIYLDTVNPNQAEQLLQEALRLSDRQDDRESRARLSELLAENLLNQGRLEEAKQYQAQARELRQEGPGQAELPVRILLRTGRLAEARQLLEAQAQKERQEPVLRPRAHRETLLLLSLVLSFQGEQAAAMQTAIEGTERGQALQSEFITAVGMMRQGHAWLLLKNEQGYHRATHYFQVAIQFSETLDVPRLKVEACWGLCQVYGFSGDLATALQLANEGIAIARAAGDEWIEASIRTVMGAGYALAGQPNEATAWLNQTQTAFRECGDTYGEAVSLLWQCLVWQFQNDSTRLKRDLSHLLLLCQEHGYDYLFLHPTLLGPLDTRRFVPLLLLARDQQLQSGYAQSLLTQMGLAGLEIHPGYQLRIQTLGKFRVWRGREELTSQAWQRKKAIQLFLLLLTHRGELLHREQICDILWPEQDPEDAARDFKIAHSTLCTVLEPERKPHTPSAFILRKEMRYGLRHEADLWLDAAAFTRLISEGDQIHRHNPAAAIPLYRQALALYHGDYLQAYPYEEWCLEEQERLSLLYLHTSEKLAQSLINQQAWDEAITICQAILARDNGWEAAYRLLLIAYDGLGQRTQVLATYARCVEALQNRWNIPPAPETKKLYERILAGVGGN